MSFPQADESGKGKKERTKKSTTEKRRETMTLFGSLSLFFFFLPKVVYITTGKVEQKGEEENKQGETQRPLKGHQNAIVFTHSKL